MLVVKVILIAEDTGVLLICNPLQSQDASIQTNVSENRVASGDLPISGLLERRLEMMTQEVIPLMPRSSGSGWATREMGAAFTMGGASYLPWLAGSLCQGITPSNSKGGLPAPEAGARAEEEGVRDEIDPSPSQSKSSQDKAEPQTAELTQRPEGVEGERDQETPLRWKQRVGVTPSH